MKSCSRCMFAVCACLAVAVIGFVFATPPAFAAPQIKDGVAYVADVSWGKASGAKPSDYLESKVVVLREQGNLYAGLVSIDEAKDKQIKKVTVGDGQVAETAAAENNTHVYMFPIASLDAPTRVTIQLASGTAAADMTIKTETLVQAPMDTEWVRLWGETALDTMTVIVNSAFSKADTVVIASANGYWDALAASSLAGALNAPVLLTDPAGLSSQTATLVKKLGATKAYVCGGTAAVTSTVETQLKGNGVKTVVRLGGADAQETALLIAQELGQNRASTAIVATSDGYWDALSASPYAYANKAPIYLTDANGNLKQSVRAAIQAAGYDTIVIAGGPAVVPAQTEQVLSTLAKTVLRKQGQTAYGTSLDFANWAVSTGMTADLLGVATGTGYWDALTGAAFCGAKNSVLILADDAYLDTVRGFVTPHAKDIYHGYVFGGEAAVGKTTFDSLQLATSAALSSL